jgi:HAD superfamily hydrolase (TIGR01549 family)
MRTARVVLCDLDDTLFDHTGTMRRALAVIRQEEPAFAAWSLGELVGRYSAILERVHAEMLVGRVSPDEARRVRYAELLAAAGVPDGDRRAGALARRYRLIYEEAWGAVEGAVAFVQALVDAGRPLGIVSNNLEAEQRTKLRRLGLEAHVDVLVTTDQVGTSKPHAAIFREALTRLGAEAGDAVMLGDAWDVDVIGARDAGIRPVWLNRRGEPTPDPTVIELRSLTPAGDAVAAVLDAGPQDPRT